MKMTRDEHVGYFDLNLTTFNMMIDLDVIIFASTFGLELIIFF